MDLTRLQRLRVFQRARLCVGAIENGNGVVDVLVQRALAAGRTDPIYHAHTRPEFTDRKDFLELALANKLARIAWAVLNKGRAFACVKTDAMASRPA